METFTLDLKQKIGAGAFSPVYRHIDPRTGQEVAIKICDSEEDRSPLLRGLDHPNIVKLISEFRVRHKLRRWKLDVAEVYPIMDGSLQDVTLDVKTMMQLLRQIIDGVKYLHKNRIIHTDLKFENILIENGKQSSEKWVAKISDFNRAREVFDDDEFSVDCKGVINVLWCCLDTLAIGYAGKRMSLYELIVEGLMPSEYCLFSELLPTSLINKFQTFYASNYNLSIDEVEAFILQVEAQLMYKEG